MFLNEVSGPTVDLREIDRQLHFSDHAEDEPQNHEQHQCQRPQFASNGAKIQPRGEVQHIVELHVQQDGDGDIHKNADDENEKKDIEDHV